MATNRDTNLNINVTATDKASPTVKAVAADVKALEGEHDVAITAQDKASDDLADIRDKLDRLTDHDKEIVLQGRADQLQREISKAERALKDIHKYDGDEIKVRLEARDNASKKLDSVRAEMRQLDGDTVDIRIDAKDSTGSSLGGGTGGLAAGLGVAGLGAGFLVAATNAADLAIQVQAIANRTGASLEDVSRLVTVFHDNGVEASDLADVLYNVNGVLRDNPELAEQLGIKIGKNTDLVDLFLQAVAGVETQFDDVGEAAVAASTLFGEEGVRQIDQVTASVGDLQTAIDGVAETRIVTDESVEAARQINTELAEAKGHMQAIGLVLLPILNGLLGVVDKTLSDPTDKGSLLIKALAANPITAPTAAWLAAGGLNGAGSDPAREQAVIRENTSGYFGGAFGAITGGGGAESSAANRGRGGNVTIINSYGTAANTVDATRVYQRRNGAQ